jgi:hypothetical protein
MSSEEATPYVPGKNKYLVFNRVTNTFEEYPVKLSETITGKFLKFAVAPPILQPGFLSYKKQVFFVSLHDLLRNHVNVSNPYTNVRAKSTDSTNPQSVAAGGNDPATDQSRIIVPVGDSVDQAASVFWSEQVESLYNTED